jgi:hypothetical protein
LPRGVQLPQAPREVEAPLEQAGTHGHTEAGDDVAVHRRLGLGGNCLLIAGTRPSGTRGRAGRRQVNGQGAGENEELVANRLAHASRSKRGELLKRSLATRTKQTLAADDGRREIDATALPIHSAGGPVGA